MAEHASKGVRHMHRSGLKYPKMKVGGHITSAWYQDKFSREKVQLSGRLGELAIKCKTSLGAG